MRSLFIGLLACLLLAPAAQAEWIEVSSDHFVILGTQSEESLSQFAERLELLHAAMARVLRLPAGKPSPSNRVTIFVVSDDDEVQRLTKIRNRFLTGIYLPRAGATVALVPTLRRSQSEFQLSGETVLYHEYAHHVLAGMTARTFPRWFVEGFAEFYAGVKFLPDGSVGIGAPATHRAYELGRGVAKIPINRLLDFDGGTDITRTSGNTFYGQSWLLYHYLQFEPERNGQLEQYQALLAAGETALAAAEGAFGDLAKLDKDLRLYNLRRSINYAVISRAALSTRAIRVRSLAPGEAAVMPARIRSDVGLTESEAMQLVPEVREVASRFPDDPAVLTVLAEIELKAGNADATIEAADRALAIDPTQVDAHIQKGYALAQKIRADTLPKDSWNEVRREFLRANKIENDHPIPLVRYYLTYLEKGEPPTPSAVKALEWAMVLAPFDTQVRWLVVQQMINDDRLQDAALTLAPLAYSPHPGEHTAEALQLLKEVEGRIAAATLVAN